MNNQEKIPEYKTITLHIPVAAPSVMLIHAISQLMATTGEGCYHAAIAWFNQEYGVTTKTEAPFDMDTLR